MAVPKRRTSKTRRNKRRSHWKLALPAMVECPKCREIRMPHRICPNCGFYKGREVKVK